jgi:hypothetical protein
MTRPIRRPSIICAKCGSAVISLLFGTVNRKAALHAYPCGHRIRETER